MTSMRKPAPFDFKTQYSLGFSAQDEEIVVDFFCGGGAGIQRLDLQTICDKCNTSRAHGNHTICSKLRQAEAVEWRAREKV